MKVQINGQVETIPDECTVARLVADRQLQPVRVAVEVNGQLVPRKDYERAVLREGDRVEMVTFVGGG